MSILLAVRDAPVVEPEEGTWTFGQKGDASGSIVENSATSLTFNARGSNDLDNHDYAYESIASGNIQIIATVPSSWTGHQETHTGFGVGFTEGTADGAYFGHAWWHNGSVTSKTGVVGSLAAQQGQSGQSLPRYIGATYNDTTKEISFWESADGADWFQIGSAVSKELTYPVLAYVFGTSHDPFETTTATLTNCAVSGTITIEEAAPLDPTPRVVHYTANFETGQVSAEDSGEVDSLRLRTLPEPQTGDATAIINNGGGGPSAAIDTKVVESETPFTNGNGAASGPCTPRRGNYFLRTVLYKNKNYGGLQNGSDKPRSDIATPGSSGFHVDFDREIYLGFSIFLPDNLETESPARRLMLLQIDSNQASRTLLKMELDSKEAGTGSGNWGFHWATTATSVTNTGAYQRTNLGSYSGDLGKWTDFVLRVRFNPFTTSTNASTISNGKNQVYPGNTGILQIWKSTGNADGNGNRAFVQVGPDIVNAPVGLVPHATELIQIVAFRAYKPTWKDESTVVDGPIWIGFDEIYYGFAGEGTTFEDVNAGRQSAP